MNIIFRATSRLLHDIRQDLERRHPFAAERVGFISIRAAKTANGLLLLGQDYHPLIDDDYIPDDSVGAMMGQDAIRKALEIALLQPVGMFHVHIHGHVGKPWFSKTDLVEQQKFVPDFFKVQPKMPHGAIVLSHDRAAGRVWVGPKKIVRIAEFDVIGSRTVIDVDDPPQRRLDVIA